MHVEGHTDADGAEDLNLALSVARAETVVESLIERGVCRDVVYDAQTAARAGRTSTGHGLPAPNPYGPFPLNMAMAAGDTPRDGRRKVRKDGIRQLGFCDVDHDNVAVG